MTKSLFWKAFGTYPLYKTVNTNESELEKSVRQKVFMKRISIEYFNRKINEGKQKFLKLLSEIGLTPNSSELYILLSANEYII